MANSRVPLRVALGVTLILPLCGTAHAQTYKYFEIYDVAHGCYLGADGSFDYGVHHYQPNDRGDYTQWRFEPAGKFKTFADSGEYYYIVDRSHGAALSSEYDLLYIQGFPCELLDYQGKSYCEWKIEPATTIGAYWLKDGEYGLSLVAGDTYDGHVYLQDPGDRRNAQWVITLADNGTIGPAFYVVSQQLLQLTMDTTGVNRIEVAPLFAIDQVVNNNTDTQQSTTIAPRTSETTSESWSFTKSVIHSLAVSINSGVSVSGVAELSSSVTKTYEESYSWTSEVDISKTIEYEWSIPVVVPPHSAVRVTATIKKFAINVPFTATMLSTLGDGTVRIDTATGTWNGVQYLTGNVDYQNVTGVDIANGETPEAYRLYAPYPNPANPSTTIRYELAMPSMVRLSVYDILGREDEVLVNEREDAGTYEVKFDASAYSSGVYFYHIQAGEFEQTKRLMVLK
jgi:hypothetical protein